MLSALLVIVLGLIAVGLPVHYVVTRRLEQKREARIAARRAAEVEFMRHLQDIINTQKGERS